MEDESRRGRRAGPDLTSRRVATAAAPIVPWIRIGLINQLHGRPGDRAITWPGISERARVAEESGFDIFVFEDALLYRDEQTSHGVWESMAVAAALAATTSTIEVGQSVVNNPYRAPALLASMATTLDEIAGGRYVLGIGAGNTDDYGAFGLPADRRYSRFAEAIEIVHSLLKNGTVDFFGEFYSVHDSELVLRGPSSSGPRITIAGAGEKMLDLVSRYADEWNWWTWDETGDEVKARLTPIIATLDAACESNGRRPESLGKTIDLYGVVAPDLTAEHGMTHPVQGSAARIAEQLLAFGQLGFTEIRCDVFPKTTQAIEKMAAVVDLVHTG